MMNGRYVDERHVLVSSSCNVYLCMRNGNGKCPAEMKVKTMAYGTINIFLLFSKSIHSILLN